MVIDNLSKYGFAEKLFNKKAQSVKKAFSSIIKKSKRKPKILTTDAGKEFTNNLFKNALKRNDIKHVIARDASKAAVVERWNRTIKEKIYKYLSYNRTKRYINVLSDIISGYNNTIHSRTKFRPIDVNKSNEKFVYRNLFRLQIPIEKQKYRLGDNVRLILGRDQFDKGYKPNYTDEIFTIYKIRASSPYYKYRVKDKNNLVVRGSYYGAELIKA